MKNRARYLLDMIFRDLGESSPEDIPKAFFDLNRCPFVTADEYLSGNVRMKLKCAQGLAEMRPDLADRVQANITALEAVQPADLSASEINVRLGATWLPTDVVREYLFQLLDTPRYCQWNIKVRYSEITGEWNIEGKSNDRGNIKATKTYGTDIQPKHYA